MVNMQNSLDKETITEKEINRATHLSLVEIIFGSVGHGFKIPLTGQFLSLYQLNVLVNALNKESLPSSSAVEISGIAAVLKSLSPAGQKLGPMLSILTQGILFWLGTLIGGVSLLGQLLGATLLCLWSFVQPLITYSLIYGFALYDMLTYYKDKLSKEYVFAQTYLIVFLVCVVFLKVMIAWFIVIISMFRKKEWVFQVKKIEIVIPSLRKSEDAAWRSALRDTFNPLFLLSFILMFIFLWQIETSLSRIIWLSLRPLAVAYLLFYLIRSPMTHRFFNDQASKSKNFKS